MSDVRNGGNFTEPRIAGPGGRMEFVAHVAWEPVGTFPTVQQAEQVVRDAFSGAPIIEIEAGAVDVP